MIIAVDFDGTICENKFPDIGEPIKDSLKYIKKLKEDGHELILWTCRSNKALDDAITWLYDNEFVTYGIWDMPTLLFKAINENTETWKERFPDLKDEIPSNKVFADIYIDDKQFGGLPDWKTIYKNIKGIKL